MAKCFRKRMETFRNHRTATMTFTWDNVSDLRDKYLDKRAFVSSAEISPNTEPKFCQTCSKNWFSREIVEIEFYLRIFIFIEFSSSKTFLQIFSSRPNAIAVNSHSNRLKFLSIFPDELFFLSFVWLHFVVFFKLEKFCFFTLVTFLYLLHVDIYCSRRGFCFLVRRRFSLNFVIESLSSISRFDLLEIFIISIIKPNFSIFILPIRASFSVFTVELAKNESNCSWFIISLHAIQSGKFSLHFRLDVCAASLNPINGSARC